LEPNKPTVRQKLKLSIIQLEAALKREDAQATVIVMQEARIADLSQHISFKDQIIAELGEQDREKTIRLAELEPEMAMLHNIRTGLLEKIDQQNILILELQKAAGEDRKLIARQNQELEQVKHSRKVMSDRLHCRKSERIHKPNLSQVIQDFGLTPEELADAKDKYLKDGYINIVKDEVPDIFNQGLPVRTTHIKPDVIPDGCTFAGHTRSRKLVYHKAWTEIHETIYHIYLEKGEEEGTFKNITNPLKLRPMKSRADISVLVQVLLDKYFFHTPLNRQLTKFEQAGVKLKHSTVTDWCNKTIRLFKPLYELMIREAIKGGILHCDETGMLVIDKSKELGKKSTRSQMWVMANPIQDFVAFQYARGRGHKDIGNILGNFKDYLHTDGYTTYNKFGNREGVHHGRCLTHCRRYFFLSLDSNPKLALHALDKYFSPLYAIERVCREQQLNYDEIAEVRQQHAVPILHEFHKWLLEQQQKVKPHKPIAKAINYTLKLWDGIMLYTTEGFLQIDNNLAERLLRDLAIGRKQWLFAGSHDAAPNAAIMFTFFGTCKLQGIDPEAWLSDVLSRLKTIPASKLADLLPQNWKRSAQVVA